MTRIDTSSIIPKSDIIIECFTIHAQKKHMYPYPTF